MRFAVTFAAVVVCCLDTIFLSVRWSLSFTFSFHPLFFFADDVLPSPVIILKTVVFSKTPDKTDDTYTKCLDFVCDKILSNALQLILMFH